MDHRAQAHHRQLARPAEQPGGDQQPTHSAVLRRGCSGPVAPGSAVLGWANRTVGVVDNAPHELSGYQVLRELKRGGMGEVLLARRRGVHGFEWFVVIKTIRADMRERRELRAMFLDEARLMGRLHHPNIAQVYDFGEQNDGLLFLVLEYVAGASFRELTKLRPDPLVTARAVAEVCHGLHAAHELCDSDGKQLEVVHRDISPSNLMLTFDGRVKILDFGIACMRDRQTPETDIGTIKGKPPYMAPEQLRGHPVDRRADIYGAGNVLFELLTGTRVFADGDPFAVARAIDLGQLKAPSDLVEDLPEGLDDVVMMAMARDPDDRFENAHAMATALEAIVTRHKSPSLATYAKKNLSDAKSEHDQLLIAMRQQHHEGGRPSNVPTVREQGQPSTAATALGEQARAAAASTHREGHGRGRRVSESESASASESEFVAESESVSVAESESGSVSESESVIVSFTQGSAVEPNDGVDATLHAVGAESEEPTSIRGVRKVGYARKWGLLVATVLAVGAIVTWQAALVPGDGLGDSSSTVMSDGPEPSQARASVQPKPVASELQDDPAAPTASPSNAIAPTRSLGSGRSPTFSAPSASTTSETAAPTPSQVLTSSASASSASPPAKLAPGFLTVGAKPYALVSVDGQLLGPTPVVRRPLPPGGHSVVLTDPSNGTVRGSRSVIIRSGELSSVIIQ